MKHNLKKLFAWTLTAAILLTMLPAVTITASAAITPAVPLGDGSAAAPYQIGTAAELYWFANQVNTTTAARSAHAVLTENITINENVLNADGSLSASAASFEVWAPIGNAFSAKYTGQFDGKGYTISGLYLEKNPTTSSYVGLFGHVGNEAVIKNVTVEDSYFSGHSGIGGIIGEVARSSTVSVENCHNGATVISHTTGNGGQAGGIIGRVASKAYLKDCTNYGKIFVNTEYAPTVNETSSAGGIVGSGRTVTLENCHNSGSVTGVIRIGGVIGFVDWKVTITKCSNTGTISGDTNIGGVVGYIDASNASTVTDCYNAGIIQATNNAGGIVGDWFSTNKKIENCHSYGTISGNNIEAIIPSSSNRTTNSYYLNTIAADDTATAKTATDFADGTVVDLLNAGRTGAAAVWEQGADYPVFTASAAHVHNWKYTADEDTDTITAVCSDSTCGADGGSVTLAAPSSDACFLNAANDPIEAEVTNTLVDTSTAVNVVYCKVGETTPLAGAPTASGTYTASITLGGATVSVEYDVFKVTKILINESSPAYVQAENTFYVSDEFKLYFEIQGENLGRINPREAQLWTREPDKGGLNIGVTYVSDTLLTGYVDEFRLYNALMIAAPSEPKSAYAQLGFGNIKHPCILKEAPQYPLYFSVGEGGTIEENVNSSLDPETAPEHTPVTLTVRPDAGYQLESLSVDGVDVTTQVSGGQYSFTMPARAVSVSATFKKAFSNLIFDANGGKWAQGNVQITIPMAYGAALSGYETEMARELSREGYTFDGWDKVLPATMPAEDLTLKAKWKVNPYTITFANTGETTIAPITQDYGTPIVVTIPAPVRTGYTFLGWDKEIPATMPVEGMVITAKWKVNQYTITFDATGGSAVAPITLDYGAAVTAPSVPTREDYIFAGWLPQIPAVMPAENLTLVAQWTPRDANIITPTTGGRVTVDDLTPVPGTPSIISPVPDGGMQVDTVTVTDVAGNPLPVTDSGDGSYRFVQPDGVAIITVTFAPIPSKTPEFSLWLPLLARLYMTSNPITAIAGEGGAVTPEGVTQVRYGRDQHYAIVPDEGFVIADVLVNGKSVGAVSEYTFTKVRRPQVIEAIFAPDPDAVAEDAADPMYSYEQP